MHSPSFALLFVALYAVTTALSAQTVYRCGNTYSQTPCPAASALPVDDARTSAQKAQADEVIRREQNTAKTMEADRLVQERKNLALRHPIRVDAKHPSKPSEPVITTLTPKRHKARHTKPKDFVAEVPGTGPLPTHLKSVKPGKDLP